MRIKQTLFMIGLGLAVSFNSCRDKGKDEPATPEENAPATTPYVLNIPSTLPAPPEMPADNPLTQQGVELGRFLFYEKQLSSSNTISCGSCHQQKFAFADNKAISPGVEGAMGTRNAMSLTNVMWDTNLNWDGSAASLEEQARTPLQAHFEMNQPLAVSAQKLQNSDIYPDMFWAAFGTRTIKPEHITKALAQFQRTLISSKSPYDLAGGRVNFISADAFEGQKLFRTHTTFDASGAIINKGLECSHCHGTGTAASKDFFNNGLELSFTDKGRGKFTNNTAENGFFKAPTLRNIELTAPYMHDGRFNTLEEVLDHYSEHIKRNSPNLDVNLFGLPETSPGETGVQMTPDEKRQIIAYLKTLTDTAFVNDKRFSNPFNN